MASLAAPLAALTGGRMSRTTFSHYLLLAVLIRVSHGIERAFLADGRRRGRKASA
jgi:hypothetical protein